ncbi:hypothetical protein AGRA3207_006100 [Actinomadura graeca]|uniref:Uncharacterized protein n=1 Tax=Actinomadura graeca TaxID=2750812 RepID=A0ABX8R1F2_9ACTN|nr:hypothetical protein [Actinomadura graeca]QXJ24718.1 hypothetical protein AGRA3207_006100 [Actinomadura graeca]
MLGNQGALPDHCADLVRTTRRHDWDGAGLAHDLAILRSHHADPAELTDGLVVLAEAIADAPLGEGPELAILAGELMDLGADTAIGLDALVPRVAEGLESAARFPELWESAGGEGLPSPEDIAQIGEVLELLNADHERLSLPPEEAGHATEAWFSVGTWARGVIVPLQRPEVRADLPHRDVLVRAVEAASGRVPAAALLDGLLRVLDGETVIVLDRAGGRGYEMTIGGIGDNAQLTILLAATLIGDGLMEGEAPAPEWVIAATDGETRPEGGVKVRLALTDAHGAPIPAEGRPSDIPQVEGRRVIVAGPEPSPKTWEAGRTYVLMRPVLTLDRALDPGEAAHWLSKTKPAAG